VLIRPSSKILLKFLNLMQKHGYIGEYEIVDDHRSKKVVVELIGRINKCGVIIFFITSLIILGYLTKLRHRRS
jgi:small subunit ribosomal protein S15Ae